MTRIIDVTRIEHRRRAGQTPQYGRLEVVHHDLSRHAQDGEGPLMAAQEVLHGLRDGELHVHLARVALHHHKEAQAPARRADTDRAVFAPVDLGAFSWGKGQLQERFAFRRPDVAHIHVDDCEATAVSGFPQPLEDLLGA
jgi:hypothetical protein